MMNITSQKLIDIFLKKGYGISKFNICGIRFSTKPNSFDDLLCVFWKDLKTGNWQIRTFPCTTEPGKYWLEHPSNPLGTACVKEGQYVDLWQFGNHQGKYRALVQCRPIVVIRDSDHNDRQDFTGREFKGLFGINCHRASDNGQSVNVEKWSAGCQVLQNRQITNPDNQSVKVFEFDYFLHLCEQSGQDNFTYTLINESDLTATA